MRLKLNKHIAKNIYKLALQKTKDTSIKQYASRIIKAHTTYNKQLMTLAAEKKVTLSLASDA